VTNAGELGKDYSLSVLMGNGNGTFQSAVSYSAGEGPTGVSVADFNGDNNMDVVVTNYHSGNSINPGNVSLWLGNGDGAFGAPVMYSVGYGPTSVATEDFNGDGNQDLAVTNWGNSNSVSVLLGNGNGAFQPTVNYAAGNGPYFVAVGEFNGDNKVDLAVANFRYSDVESTVSILLGNGDGTFGTPQNFRVGSQPDSLAVADFNGDQKSDLAVGDFSSGRVSILVGNGDGTFQNLENYGAGSPSSIVVADFNGDTHLDLAVAAGSLVGLLSGMGDATFGQGVFYPAAEDLNSAVAGDFNGDGQPDLAIAGGSQDSVSIWINSCWWNNYLPALLR
jgi:hypothetical protein